ncbi:hypothetical protein [Streptomyces sp. TLI_171]|uniref:hypothetical protein n=1 Tax=Streptomyces sp. TLI_171 TaxID=1938859 RepID=UPI000C18B063|nr:hypothetical protein [Streptomyces sp. TLI_171]RKE21701.1 hypothetical protein BX266_5100 [Streptomyces sp. TLI_171]
MPFSVTLHPPAATSLPADREPELTDEEHDFASLVIVGAGDLAAAGATASAGGFGTDSWYFGPQGLERSLAFAFPTPDTVTVTCASRTDWTPSPAVEHHRYGALRAQLRTLAQDFATALETVGSPAAPHAPFPAWREGRFDPS